MDNEHHQLKDEIFKHPRFDYAVLVRNLLFIVELSDPRLVAQIYKDASSHREGEHNDSQ
jgi:hypothetical protein